MLRPARRSERKYVGIEDSRSIVSRHLLTEGGSGIEALTADGEIDQPLARRDSATDAGLTIERANVG
jgi:hypothetical protein